MSAAAVIESDAGYAIDRSIRDTLSRRGRAEWRRVPQVIGAIGVGRGVGVTTIATSLAHVLASDFDTDVCFLDLTGTESELSAGSLASLVDGSVTVEDFFGRDDASVKGTGIGAVDEAEWHSLIRSQQFARTIEQLRKQFGFVVVDLPPIVGDGRTMAAAQHIDGYLLVARHGKSRLSDIEAALSDLSDIDEIGIVINRYRPRTPKFLRGLLRIR